MSRADLSRRDDASVAAERAGSLLDTLDFGAIDDMDPSTADGYRVIFERECPIELRLQESIDEPQDVGNMESIKAKILALGEEGAPQSIRVELSSESDLFFHYMHVIDESGFHLVQEQQKLVIDFREYPSVLISMLNNTIKDPHQFLAVFVMQPDGMARLDFIQNMEYKFVDLLSVSFVRSPDDVVRQQICYRYNSMKSRLALMQARLQDVSNLVKIKNPSLLLQLQRSPTRPGGSTRRR